MRVSEQYFSDDEIRCKGVNCGCGNVVIIDTLFDSKLLELREAFGQPMKVNSCCRCKVHNAEVGGAPKSFHISDHPAWPGVNGTAAIDVYYPNITVRDQLAHTAWRLGFRIGYNKKFLHLDSGHHHGSMAQSIFKYDNVSDTELEAFRKDIAG